MQGLTITIVPLVALVLGATVAVLRRPSAAVVAGVQHFAAGVVFAAAAGEILPDLKHAGSPMPVLVGGLAGVALMLLVRRLGERAKGPAGLIAVTALDVFIDGLVLGIAFAAGERAGLLLTIALTIEILFLGLVVALELGEAVASRAKVIVAAAGIGLLLPLGALTGAPVAVLPPMIVTGFFAFGLVSLLYLVTEELLVEAHQAPEGPVVTAMFFAGFLLLLTLEEMVPGAGA